MKSISCLAFSLFFIILFSESFAQIPPVEEVTIVRDKWGVPHIYGKTDAQVAYGLAWANAEDDFQTVEANMLMARCRAGEVTGTEGAIIDYAVHLFRVRELVEEKYETDVSDHFKGILEGYCAGLNAYVVAHPDEVSLEGIFPANPKDILAAYCMSLAIMTGVDYHLRNILDGKPGAATPFSLRGSNAWAYNSSITEKGDVHMVSNSHQPLDGQGTWYEAHLVSEEGLNITGATFPGGLSIFVGTNENIAWTHTVNYEDFADVYELEMNPQQKNQYKFDGEWVELEERKVTLKVKLGKIILPVSKKVWWSKYGATIKKGKGYYSLRFAANMDIRAAEQWHTMNKAQNFTQFKKTLDMVALPGMNIVYADRYDTIYYLNNAMFPLRDPEFDWVGMLPGNTSKTLWNEFHPVEDIVQSLNPPSGYVYNSNNTPFHCTAPEDNPDPADYDPTMGNSFVDNNRSYRFQELIKNYDKVSYADIKEIKYDMAYPNDSIYLFYIRNINQLFKLDPKKYPSIAESITLLKDWDKNSNIESVGASLFVLSFKYLHKIASTKYHFPSVQYYEDEVFVKAIKHAQSHLKQHFGTIQVPLGELQRIVRGEKDFPIRGLPDVLSTMYTKSWKKGRYKAFLGDSYIQFATFPKGGGLPILESCHSYGASNKKESEHYDDQIPLFINQKLKPMTLDRETVFKNAAKVYSPGK